MELAYDSVPWKVLPCSQEPAIYPCSSTTALQPNAMPPVKNVSLKTDICIFPYKLTGYLSYPHLLRYD
jgi:hypothetical protein